MAFRETIEHFANKLPGWDLSSYNENDREQKYLGKRKPLARRYQWRATPSTEVPPSTVFEAHLVTDRASDASRYHSAASLSACPDFHYCVVDIIFILMLELLTEREKCGTRKKIREATQSFYRSSHNRSLQRKKGSPGWFFVVLMIDYLPAGGSFQRKMVFKFPIQK